MRLFKRRTSADLEDPQLTGLRFESAHNQGETKFLSQNSSIDDNISIATAPTPEPRLIMSHSPRSLKKLSSGKRNFLNVCKLFISVTLKKKMHYIVLLAQACIRVKDTMFSELNLCYLLSKWST